MHVAHTVQSKPLQYFALAGFVVAQAIGPLGSWSRRCAQLNPP
jgi:hypothetical protein